MNLKLTNTLTRTKEAFTPLDATNVRLYVCGPTVYDYAHIGNARPLIVFDVLYRLLRHVYGADHVTYVRNITDVDDKINARAAERGISIRELTEGTNAIFQADVAALGCLPPTHQPRATEHIAGMITIIERLVALGFAYVAEDHVLFSPPAMDAAKEGGESELPRYGALANRSLDEMQAGARVDVAPYKRGPTDFVLWKPSKEGEPGWTSPCGIAGLGRPGWHIECSAMSHAFLGETFDIHGGGIDLVFPHHENEIAQTCCAFGVPRMAQVWMHNGFLQVEGEKMSKSLGNFVTIHELLHTDNFGGRAWSGAVLRLAMLRTHYRQPIDWTVKALEESEKTLAAWADLARRHKVGVGPDKAGPPHPSVVDALSDDLNTAAAMAALAELAKAGRQNFEPAQWLAGSAQFLGFDTSAWVGAAADPNAGLTEAKRAQIEGLIAERIGARRAKDFAASDRLRDELVALGVQLKDGKDAQGEPVTTWEVKG